MFRTDIRNPYKICTVDADMTVHFTERRAINYQLKHLWMHCPECKTFLQLKKDPQHPHYMLLKCTLITCPHYPWEWAALKACKTCHGTAKSIKGLPQLCN